MSEYVWCHGTNCHKNHTLDRVRGSKDNKVLRTRKIQFNPEYINMYSYFCSNQCYNDFANANIEQIIAIAPRREPLETPIENPERTKVTTSYGYTYYNNRITEREVWQYWQWCMVQDSGIMHLLTKRRNMNEDINDRSINPLIRIANTLDEILRLVKKDMDDSKARITEQWDKEVDKEK